MTTRILSLVLALMAILPLSAQKRTSSTATPKGTVVSFSSGDIWSVASDSRNVYVTTAWTRNLFVINKTSGVVSKVAADDEVQAVAVAGDVCYYYVANKGLFIFNPATSSPVGPLPFNIDMPLDSSYKAMMSVSPDNHYLLLSFDNSGSTLIDLLTRTVVSKPDSGFWQAVNNLGGTAIGAPEAIYQPLGQPAYTVTDKVVVRNIFCDPVSGDYFFSCEEGVGRTPSVPAPDSGLKRIHALQDKGVKCVARDSDGNFIFGLNNGIAIGGATPDAPLTTFSPLDPGVKNSYGSNITMSEVRIIAPDGQGNILAASIWNNILVIFNPDGLKGYKQIAGKLSEN